MRSSAIGVPPVHAAVPHARNGGSASPGNPRRRGASSNGAWRASCRAELGKAIAGLKDKLAAEKPTVATRKASELALDVITVAMPELILGSADLTPSNNIKTKNLTEIKPGASTAATSTTAFASMAWRRP